MDGSSGTFGYFWLHRLHSLAGMVLAAAFLCCFLIPYSSIFDGAAAFNRVMAAVDGMPLRGWFELCFIAVPLVFHALMGVLVLSTSSVSVLSYGFSRNWMYVGQRLAGLVLIPFVGYHIYATRLVPAFNGRPVDEALLHRILATMPSKLFYAVGLAALAFYAGNGLALAAKAWGITARKRSRDVVFIVGWVATLVGAAWGVRIIMAF